MRRVPNGKQHEIHIPPPSRRLLAVSRQWCFEFICDELGAIHDRYIAEHISDECELRLLRNTTFDESFPLYLT